MICISACAAGVGDIYVLHYFNTYGILIGVEINFGFLE